MVRATPKKFVFPNDLRSVKAKDSALKIDLVGQFETDRDVVVAAMLFPSDESFRAAYLFRKQIERDLNAGIQRVFTADERRQILDLPSRKELRAESDKNARHGVVAGDLVAIMYDRHRRGKPASKRDALLSYAEWAMGKKYGDGEAMKYSPRQLDTYFASVRPAAHLWGAWRLIASIQHKAQPQAEILHSEPPFRYMLGVAAEVQRFVALNDPGHTRGPTISIEDLLALPSHIAPIPVDPLM